VEVEPAELAKAENVGEAAGYAEGSDAPREALRSRRKRILIAHVQVARPQRTDVGSVRSVHDIPPSQCGIPLVRGGDRTGDTPSQRRKHVPRERGPIVRFVRYLQDIESSSIVRPGESGH
jgi:hypothetical protein